MQFTHPAESVGRGGCINPVALRDALIARGLLVPRAFPPRRHPRARDIGGPVLELDELGRRVAAARIADQLGRDDRASTLAGWLGADYSRLPRVQKGA